MEHPTKVSQCRGIRWARAPSLRAEKLELLGRVAMGVAHDFNNLLTIMTSIADALRREPSPLERAHLLVDLDETIARAGLMTAQLLSLGRPQADGLVDVDLSEQTRALAPLLPRLLGADIQEKITAFGGSVSVVSAPGQGTTFEIKLARVARPLIPAPPSL